MPRTGSVQLWNSFRHRRGYDFRLRFSESKTARCDCIDHAYIGAFPKSRGTQAEMY